MVFYPTLYMLMGTLLLMFLIPNILSWLIVHAIYRRKMQKFHKKKVLTLGGHLFV